jgi:PST family polysaccharide transporter
MVGSWLVCHWRPARPAPASGLGELLRYGGGVTASGLASAFARSVDQILIGWLWGPVVLGLYERTTRLVLLPVNTINAPVYAAAMPALSRLVERPERYRSMFRQIMQKLVRILFGPGWVEATPLVALFSVTAAYLPVLLAAGLLFMTHGRTAEMLRATLIDGTLCVASIVVGLLWNVVGVAASIAIVGLLVRLPMGFWLSTRRGPVSMADILTAIAPAACAALAGAAAASLLRHYAFTGADPTVTGILVVGASAGLAMLLAVLAWPETRRELFGIVRWPAAMARPQA